MSRFTDNIRIIELLRQVAEEHPDWRFGQILVNTDAVQTRYVYDEQLVADPFYEEPGETLQRMQRNFMTTIIEEED